MPLPKNAPVITRRRVGDEVYVQLREAIVDGRIPMGAPVRENELIALTGASRAPVREAVNRLRTEAFVDVAPGRTVRIGFIGRRDATERLRAAYLIVRQVAFDIAPTLTAGDIAAMRAEAAGPDGNPLAALDRRVLGPLLRRSSTLVQQQVVDAVAVQARWMCAAYPEAAASLIPTEAEFRWFAAVAERRDGRTLVRLVDRWFRVRAHSCVIRLPPSTPRLALATRSTSHHRSLGTRTPIAWTVAPLLLRDQAIQAILGAITSGRLVAGESLKEESLVQWLGMSRGPVGEALSSLEALGVIEAQPSKFRRVRPADRAHLRSTCEVLAVVGGAAALLGVPALDDADRRALARAAQQLDAAVAADRFTDALRAVGTHLRVIVSASGDSALAAVVACIQPFLAGGVLLERDVDPERVRRLFAPVHQHAMTGDAPRTARAVRRFYRAGAVGLAARPLPQVHLDPVDAARITI